MLSPCMRLHDHAPEQAYKKPPPHKFLKLETIVLTPECHCFDRIHCNELPRRLAAEGQVDHLALPL